MERLSGSDGPMPGVRAPFWPGSAVHALLSGEVEGVLFDGAGFGPAAPLAVCPSAVLSGGWGDWGLLEAALARGTGGGLAGWFDYEGNFRFGDFASWEDSAGDLPDGRAPATATGFSRGLDAPDWISLVERARAYIAAGDIYQVNLTHSWHAPWSGPAAGFYPRLRAASPAPFSCLLRLGDTEVLSTSPECFLRIEGRRIVTRPIKGTRPRGGDDAAAARELVSSPKERAELVMITDLERNDLGQVCHYGTVRVTGLCELESFAQVHHLVSTVEGRLRPEVSALQAVRACYPGGSITGAPKKRAREIIAELETAPRGIYTGALGFFGRDGRAVFNIAIRTLVVRDGRAAFGVGAGIVADSDPAAEYAETLHKAAGLFAALS
jgi:para-aminobenzoate synthetase component 1